MATGRDDVYGLTDTSEGNDAMLTLIHHGTVYAPEPRGRQSILLAGSTIHSIGTVDAGALRALDPPCQVIDASDCLVVPGFVDPHAHLLGAGGEQGPGSRMPELHWEELALAGMTTVVGCLGTDTTTRTLPALVGKARELEAGGITAYVYTGGFPIPPRTLTGSVVDDLVLIDRVIGVGEVGINDLRASEPALQELARVVSEAIVGGMVGGKAGVTHFHVGDGKHGLQLLRDLLDQHEIAPRAIYPTHINRTDTLLAEGIALARRGCFVDMDTVDGELPGWLRRYCAHDGPLSQLTVSSDARTPGGSPGKRFANFQAAAQAGILPLDEVLPLFTRNPATVLGLPTKGQLQPGMDADLLVLRHDTLAVVHVIAGGRHVVAQGQVVAHEESAA
jgi:beta-aspartyl-dipeptidase (metallo-type)